MSKTKYDHYSAGCDDIQSIIEPGLRINNKGLLNVGNVIRLAHAALF